MVIYIYIFRSSRGGYEHLFALVENNYAGTIVSWFEVLCSASFGWYLQAMGLWETKKQLNNWFIYITPGQNKFKSQWIIRLIQVEWDR